MSRSQRLGGLVVGGVLASLLLGCGQRDVAVVNGTPISRRDFASELERGPYARNVLRDMINRVLVDRAFEKAGLKFPAERLESEIKQSRAYYGLQNDQEYQAFLVSQGLTDADIRQKAEMSIKLEMLGQKDLKYTEQDLRKFFDDPRNRGRYDVPEQVAYSEIVVNSKKEADDVYAMASKPGAKFPDLAKQYSVVPSRTSGGQYPLRSRQDIVPLEVRERAFAQGVGTVSQPFAVQEQWSILQVNDHRPAKKLSFDEARQKVEADYKTQSMVQPADLLTRLASEAQVKIVDPNYASLQRMFSESDLLRNAPGGKAPVGPPGGAPPGAGPRPGGPPAYRGGGAPPPGTTPPSAPPSPPPSAPPAGTAK